MCYFVASWEKGAFLFYPAEAVVQRCSVKKVFLEISQNSQENTCARVYFLIKLQTSGFFWIPFFLIVEDSFLHILYEFHEIKLNGMKYTLNYVFHEIVWNISQCILVFKRIKGLVSENSSAVEFVSSLDIEKSFIIWLQSLALIFNLNDPGGLAKLKGRISTEYWTPFPDLAFSTSNPKA